MARDLAQYVGEQIKLRRVQARMTQVELAEMAGITQAALSKIERGESDIMLSTLAVLRSALALDITIAPLGKS